MYIVEVRLRDEQISTTFMTKLQAVQKFAMDWSKNKHTFLGFRVPFHDFNVFVYDVSIPCHSHHIETPLFIYY